MSVYIVTHTDVDISETEIVGVYARHDWAVVGAENHMRAHGGCWSVNDPSEESRRLVNQEPLMWETESGSECLTLERHAVISQRPDES